jgi:REP element-mobilizing transposase RayT
MGFPRSKYVQEGQEGVYHCFSRCVRRAFLYGFDALTRQDFTHRKAWLVDRLRYLAAIFAIEVCAYAVMENHYHTILRTRPDIVASWSDREVATRWLTLFPRHRGMRSAAIPPADKEIRALADCPERIAKLRQRLSSLSWFMGRLNEFIARAANKEDRVKGRFWESRFKCQALLDGAAIAACMVYVDLNPIRAGLAATPEESDFTSIQERIRAWQKETMTTASVPGEAPQDLLSGSFGRDMRMLENAGEIPNPIPERISAPRNSFDDPALSACWLCPIQSDSERRGILQMTTAEYFDLVDKSARMTRSDKPGVMEADLAPILLRIGANPEAWLETITRFGSKFSLAAGLLANLRHFADQLGRRWLKGVATARAAFASSPPQLA